MEIKINGGIRSKNGRILLTLYSTPLARYFLKNSINRINLFFKDDSIEIYPGDNKKIVFERIKENHPLAGFCLTKITPEKIKKNLNYNKQISIPVIIKNLVSSEDLEKFNERVTHIKPNKTICKLSKEELSKIGCFISCFRNNKRIWYRFSIRHRAFERVAKNHEKVMIYRKGDDFFLVKDKLGKEFNLYLNSEGHPLTYMQISELFLNEKEKKLFESGNRRAISFRAYFSYKDFDLNMHEFLYDKEERELANALVNLGIKIAIPEMGKREADILLPDFNSQIEVTKIMPVILKKQKNNAHGEGIHINARLCEGFLRVQKNLVNKFFIVFHEDWKDYAWVRDICEMIKPSVIPVFTDFGEGWAEKSSNEINSWLLK